MRKLITFLVSPLVPSMIISPILVITGNGGEVWTAFLAAITVGYPVAIFIGLPVDYVFLSKYKYRNFRFIFAATTIVTLLFSSVLLVADAFSVFGGNLWFSSGFWLLTSLFWLVFTISSLFYYWLTYGVTTDPGV